MTERLVLVFLILFALAPASRAQLLTQGYVLFGMGNSQTRTSDVRLEQPSLRTDVTFSGVHWGLKPLQPTPYYSMRIGAWVKKAPRFGIELDYTHNKAVAATGRTVLVSGAWLGQPLEPTLETMDKRVQRLRVTNGVNIISMNALYRFSESKFQPYLGAGPSFYFVWSSVEVGGPSRDASYRQSGFGYELLGGVRYHATSYLGLYAEAKYTDGTARLAVPDGTMRTPLRTWHGQFGVLIPL